jgi:hypothetical protein
MISLELTGRFKRIIREHGRHEEVATALKLVQEGFGKPHVHAGISIRKLGKKIFECRTSLEWRLIFQAQKGVLIFDFAGDHDEVKAYLRAQV